MIRCVTRSRRAPSGRLSARHSRDDEREVREGESESIWVTLDDKGRAKLEYVPAGTYWLRYTVDEEEKSHEFRVPQTRTFKLP